MKRVLTDKLKKPTIQCVATTREDVDAMITLQRRHLAELVTNLPNDLWMQYQEAGLNLPGLMAAVAENRSFATVKCLSDAGYSQLSEALRDLVAQDLRGALVSS